MPSTSLRFSQRWRTRCLLARIRSVNTVCSNLNNLFVIFAPLHICDIIRPYFSLRESKVASFLIRSIPCFSISFYFSVCATLFYSELTLPCYINILFNLVGLCIAMGTHILVVLLRRNHCTMRRDFVKANTISIVCQVQSTSTGLYKLDNFWKFFCCGTD